MSEDQSKQQDVVARLFESTAGAPPEQSPDYDGSAEEEEPIILDSRLLFERVAEQLYGTENKELQLQEDCQDFFQGHFSFYKNLKPSLRTLDVGLHTDARSNSTLALTLHVISDFSGRSIQLLESEDARAYSGIDNPFFIIHPSSPVALSREESNSIPIYLTVQDFYGCLGQYPSQDSRKKRVMISHEAEEIPCGVAHLQGNSQFKSLSEQIHGIFDHQKNTRRTHDSQESMTSLLANGCASIDGSIYGSDYEDNLAGFGSSAASSSKEQMAAIPFQAMDSNASVIRTSSEQGILESSGSSSISDGNSLAKRIMKSQGYSPAPLRRKNLKSHPSETSASNIGIAPNSSNWSTTSNMSGSTKSNLDDSRVKFVPRSFQRPDPSQDESLNEQEYEELQRALQISLHDFQNPTNDGQEDSDLALAIQLSLSEGGTKSVKGKERA